MLVFSGSSSMDLALGVSRARGSSLGELDTRRFPDGEYYINVLSKVIGEDCVVIQSTQTNDLLVELIFILDTLNDLGAGNIDVVIPYMGYSRQDKRFKPGESLSAKTVLKLIDGLSDSIRLINAHFLDCSGKSNVYGIELCNLDAFPAIAGYFQDRFSDPVILAPDKGSLGYAKKTAALMECDFDYLHKTRISDTEVEIATKKLNVSGKDVIILDDMISTGGTIIEAANILRSQGAASVNVGCVHGVFSKGIAVFEDIVDDMVCTDTLETDISHVSVSSLIADSL